MAAKKPAAKKPAAKKSKTATATKKKPTIKSDTLNGSIAVEDEISKSFLDYAMSVIVSRALPDVKDGLKPVQRRIYTQCMKQELDQQDLSESVQRL